MTTRKTQLDGLAISLLLACCLFWALQQILVKATMAELAPAFQASLRFAGASLLVMGFGAFRLVDRRHPRALARTIRDRFPYIDPLNHVQLELLKRYRAGDTDERVVQGIHLTINGIAAGLKNTG